ncbi:hypothetical protein [Streptomyces sp. NBC_00094]|uniref:hypothetical protein n=1 Tax=Streptomyces sp. NBC_00094 TaxID=2903620 RepID=UPI002258E870|nr:hypothetical protein [Streptomyces sp. NBC_00094]MCX5392382.1 hypothetical protein [Streptomyces sp. NBC_00094]
MGLTRSLSDLGPFALAGLTVSLSILLFTLVCYLAAFPRRRRDARAIRGSGTHGPGTHG